MYCTIREAAEKTGISAYVLRYYEKEGLLPKIQRSRGGIRRYTEEDIELLGLISCLKKTGMALKEIRTFVELNEKGPSTLRARCEILEKQKAFVAERLAEMQQTYEKVSCKLEYFSGLREEYEQGAM